MKLITNITDEAAQQHTILFADDEITLRILFHPFNQMWTIDVTYKGKSRYGVKLAVNTLHLRSENYPFDFYVADTSDSGLDPVRREDFELGRCQLYMLEPDDMQDIRGQDVQI